MVAFWALDVGYVSLANLCRRVKGRAQKGLHVSHASLAKRGRRGYVSLASLAKRGEDGRGNGCECGVRLRAGVGRAHAQFDGNKFVASVVGRECDVIDPRAQLRVMAWAGWQRTNTAQLEPNRLRRRRNCAGHSSDSG